jgi:cytochrome c biogenesis protein CcdA
VPTDLAGLAFAAGLVAALNPCGFAMLPVYLAYVVSAAQPGRSAAVVRALIATAVMTLGFVVVFAVFGTLTVALASTIQPYLPVVTVVIGVALVAVGIWLLSGRSAGLTLPAVMRPDAAPTASLLSMFGYGVAYAVASLSCTVGPFLAVTTAGVRSGSVASAVTVYLAYAAGFALIVGTLAVGAPFTSSALADRLRRALPVIGRIGGLLVLIVGLYVAYYGVYELRLFHTDAGPDDGVISAAGRIQSAIAGWVHQHGAWPWLIVLAVLLAVAGVWRWRHIRRRAWQAPQTDG